jgi:hypothetical protein
VAGKPKQVQGDQAASPDEDHLLLNWGKMKQLQGYSIVMKQPLLLARYLKVHLEEERRKKYISDLRDALQFLNPEAYRGISRDHLSAYPTREKRFIKDFGFENQNARMRMLDFVEYYPYPEFDRDLLVNIDQARELFDLLDKQDEYEIIFLASDSFSISDRTLGFDIGYWGGDHFSLICDTAITPMWHPANPRDFGELGDRLRMLNRNALFNNENDAADFRQYYKARGWAEKEATEGEFSIIQVNEVSP